jgi:hypothetical protein
MSPFLSFLELVLREGRALLDGPPALASADRPAAADRLQAAFNAYALEIAGPPLSFAADAALEAAQVLAWSCWLLLDRGEPEAGVERHLPLPAPLHSAGQQLSSDLVLRYLPAVHRRARALAVDDPLTRRLAEVLRRRPLSGVLADIEDGPLAPVDLEGHPGLLLLYAERLAEHPRPAWVPSGPGREYYEMVGAQRR